MTNLGLRVSSVIERVVFFAGNDHGGSTMNVGAARISNWNAYQFVAAPVTDVAVFDAIGA
jgi:hypothetical protein